MFVKQSVSYRFGFNIFIENSGFGTFYSQVIGKFNAECQQQKKWPTNCRGKHMTLVIL